jgi:hypothetical protein
MPVADHGRQPLRSISFASEAFAARSATWRRTARRARQHARRAVLVLGHVLGVDAKPRLVAAELSRFAWIGTLLLLGLSTEFVIIWQTASFFSGDQPPAVLLGWGVLRRAVVIYGEPMRTLQVAVGAAAVALAVAFATEGFRVARRPGRIASIGIGVAGVAAAVPQVIMAAVILWNIGIWVAVVTLLALFAGLWVPLLFVRWLLR